MGRNTKISWADHTVNFWAGCTEISKSGACDNCYARELSERYGWAQWGNHPRHKFKAPVDKLRSINNAARSFFKKHGRPQRVFINSLSDVFDNQVPEEWRQEAWECFREFDETIYMLLTKRPSNIAKMVPDDWFTQPEGGGYPNVWLGTTVEHPDEMGNLDHLLAVPAPCHFVSAEPLLHPMTFPIEYMGRRKPVDHKGTVWDHIGINLVIAGGESGDKARPWHPEWESLLRFQCEYHGVAYHWKQHGTWRPHKRDDKPDRETLWVSPTCDATWPGDQGQPGPQWVKMLKSKVHVTGAEIGGRTYQNMPDVAWKPLREPEQSRMWGNA